MQRIGGLFLRMLQMVAVPLIVTSLMTGIMGLAPAAASPGCFDARSSTICRTSLLAIVTGLVVVNTYPSRTARASRCSGTTMPTQPTPLGEVLFNQLETMIPENPLGAMADAQFFVDHRFYDRLRLFAVAVGGETAERIHRFAVGRF